MHVASKRAQWARPQLKEKSWSVIPESLDLALTLRDKRAKN